jgi:glycosyltransferase involved in cell wall biosynthesis
VRAWGSIVCLSTADFDAPVWTNKQHIMSRLARHIPVLYIDSLGLRAPRLAKHDLSRMMRRMRSRPLSRPTAPGGSVARPVILSPLLWPFHSSRAARRLNRIILQRALRGTLTAHPAPRLLWTYNPVVVDELDLTQFDTVVYHCVDDLSTIPRVSARAIESTEPRVVRRADATFATTGKLAARLSSFGGHNVHLVGNVADFDHFATALAEGDIPLELAAIPPPRALFIGSLSDYKVDWLLFARVARDRPDWSFVLIGPEGDETAADGVSLMSGLSNTHVLGHRPYETLPAYLRGADAALIPYLVTPHTEAVFPLKTWEYLAAGLHVVSTRLPAVCAVEPPLEFATTPAEFARALDLSHNRTVADRQAAARQWTWDGLLERMFRRIPPPPRR